MQFLTSSRTMEQCFYEWASVLFVSEPAESVKKDDLKIFLALNMFQEEANTLAMCFEGVLVRNTGSKTVSHFL